MLAAVDVGPEVDHQEIITFVFNARFDFFGYNQSGTTFCNVAGCTQSIF
jgi:hypothetical protein